MVITTNDLMQKYVNYADPIGKIHRDIAEEKIYPIVKGMYETDENTFGAKIAQYIYGPSYISLDYVLYSNSLIPEAVYNTYTCVSYNKRKRKTYTNRFGTFTYRDVPNDVFSYGVKFVQDGDYCYHIASPEKALCDKLYSVYSVDNLKELNALLFDDLRIDEDELKKLDVEFITKIAPLYNSKNLRLLVKYLQGE